MFEPTKKTERAQSQDRALVLRNALTITPSASPFQTPEEAQYFQFFTSKTANLISIYSQRHFWTIIIPQATHQHPAVKHSVLALTILHESLARTDGLAEDDNERLLHHYNTAIRALTQSQPSTDIVLITCILFWTVENFNGTGKPSFDHMKAAQKILREFKAKENHAESPHFQVINKYIEPIVIDAVQHARARTVEDVTESRKGSDLSDGIPSSIDQILPARLPSTLPILDAAQEHLRTCTRALLHVLNNDLPEGDVESLIERIEMHLQRWVYLFHGLTGTGKACHRRMLITHHVNVTTLLAEVKKSQDMELHQEEDFKSQYTWNVTEVEDLLASVSLSKDAPFVPRHDLGLIPPLFTAAVRCTDPDVSGKAISMLKSMDRTEGCWSDSMAARITETILQSRKEAEIGVQLNKISVYSNDWGVGICSKELGFERFLEDSKDDVERFDMVSHNPSYPSFGRKY